jgi:hypothetical protein
MTLMKILKNPISEILIQISIVYSLFGDDFRVIIINDVIYYLIFIEIR